MRFAYLGTPEAADPEGTLAFGQYFPIGVAVEVGDPAVIRKLSGHQHFKTIEGGEHPPSDEVEALRVEAESLGIDVDGRWGVKTLRAEISKAKG